MSLADLTAEPLLFDAVMRAQRGALDLPIWLHLAGEASGPVLELGSGSGRVLVSLWDAGIDAWGLEADAQRAGLALQAEASSGLPQAERVRRLLTADARAWADPGRFALVLAPFNFLGLFDDGDALQILARVRENLAPDGLLALEAQLWPGATAVGASGTSAARELRIEAHPVTYQEVVTREPDGWLAIERTFTFLDGSARTFPQRLHVRPLPALSSLLVTAGFDVLQPRLDEAGRAPGPDSRLVFLRCAVRA